MTAPHEFARLKVDMARDWLNRMRQEDDGSPRAASRIKSAEIEVALAQGRLAEVEQ